MSAVMTERLMPRNTRANLFRSWGSLIGMLPVGGPNIWGNTTWAPDDSPAMAKRNETHGYSHCQDCSLFVWPCLYLHVVACACLRHVDILEASSFCGCYKVVACFQCRCGCSSFFSRKDGPYLRTLSLGQVLETFSFRNFKDWMDWLVSKSKIKVGLHSRCISLPSVVTPVGLFCKSSQAYNISLL